MNQAKQSCMDLNGEWALSWRDMDPERRDIPRRKLTARVPGDVHLDLLGQGKIKDPVIGDAVTGLKWIGEKEWWYRKRFTTDGLPEGRRELVFDGLCFVADVWLNGRYLGSHRNMHRPCRFDVTELCEDRNDLAVRLLAFPPEAADRMLGEPEWGARWNEAVNPFYCRNRGWMRKAAYSFGWDWTQGLALCGIWRPVRLESTPVARLEDLYVRARTDGTVNVSMVCRSVLASSVPGRLSVVLRDYATGEALESCSDDLTLSPGTMTANMHLYLRSPRLWWPVGMGPQNLYLADVSLEVNDEVVAESRVRFGVRDIAVSEPRISEDRSGFRFVVNGTPVYARGADWVPPDIIPARITKARYERLIGDAVEAGLNYLRFWGGGIYEGPEFYRLCDERGIMLWHDMMFGNHEFPDFDPGFVEEARKEFIWAIKSLRNHPCIVIWCGSNETDQVNAKFKPTRPNGRYYGETMLHEMFPRWLQDLDTTREYKPSSGCVGKHSEPGEYPGYPKRGVCHAAFRDPFGTDEVMDEVTASFINEWAAGSPPVKASLTKMLKCRRPSWNDPLVEYHNILPVLESRGLTAAIGDAVTHHDMSDLSAIPFDELCDIFREWHAGFMTRCIEHYRRRKWLCSGNAFWMFNSAFTMMDWSVVDYFGVPKPAFYAVKRSNRSLLPVVALYADRLEAHVVNDTREPVPGRLGLSVVSFTGECVLRRSLGVTVPANGAERFIKVPLAALDGFDRTACFARVEFQADDGSLQVVNHRMLDRIKYLKMPVADVVVKPAEGSDRSFVLESPRFVRWVELAPHGAGNRPDDNYFDLLPGEPKTVTFRKPVRPEKLRVGWSNTAEAASCRLSRFAPEAPEMVPGISLHFDIELFNARSTPERMAVTCSCPDGVTAEHPSRVDVPPAGVCACPVTVHADPFRITPGMLELTMTFGQTVVSKQVRVLPAFRVSPDGAMVVHAEDVHAGDGRGELEFRCQTRDGRKVTERLGASDLAGGKAGCRVDVPADVNPLSGELWVEGRYAGGYWLGGESGASVWESLPKRLYAGGALRSARARSEDWPNLFETVEGVLFSEACPSGEVRFHNAVGISLLVFVHHDPASVFFDILVKGVDWRQPHVDDGNLWQGTSIELAVSADRTTTDVESVLTLTRAGPRVWVRRCGGRPQASLERNPYFKAFALSESRVVTYHYALKRAWLSAPHSRELGMALVMNSGDERCIEVFEGIRAKKAPELFGELVLS